VNALELPDVAVIDALGGPAEERLALLSSCGLAEPKLALRLPSELSDGQRARLRIALGWNQAKRVLMIDELAALLDRATAKVLAFNLRRMVTKNKVGALVATTHEDIEDELNPDVTIRCRGDGHIEVTRRDVAKKVPASSASFGSRRAPAAIGRTSLGGITAAMDLVSSRK
jgi:ABC-type ATPase with predicted acetyltransferase domain